MSMHPLKALVIEEDGQSLVEYGLILGLVSVAVIAILTQVKDSLGNIFKTISSELGKAAKTARGK